MSGDITNQITATARSRFGIENLKPYQLLVIQRIMEQEDEYEVRNQLVILPTGTGKSLCFLLPAIMCKGVTVIVYPLLALMNDQVSKLQKANIPCVTIRGGQTRQQRKELFNKLRSGCKIVVTTPESLQTGSVLSELRKFRISLLVVDEAHVISRWGKDFRPAYLSLTNILLKLRPHQTLAFTATASPKTINEIRICLFPSRPLIVRGDADRPNIIYRAYPTLNRIQGLIDLVRTCKKPALVFCSTREQTRRMCMALRMECPGIPSLYYNAGLSRSERNTIEDWFQKSDNGVLLATSAYGMGIDKKNLRTVIHYRLPNDIEEYLQESGRAGRDGEIAESFVIVTHSDINTNDPYSPVLEIFTKNQCRRIALLAAIGQIKDECTGCDFCFGNIAKMNGLHEIKMLIGTRPFHYNTMMAAYTLSGCRNQSMNQFQTIRNPLYASLKNWNPRLLNDSLIYLSEKAADSPISCVPLHGRGNLLYPGGHFLYNASAEVIRRLDDGYCWIIRKVGKRGKRNKKV